MYKSKMLSGFKQFILRGNVVDLAIGVVIGAAFNSIVSAFVKDILTPFIALAGGGNRDFANLTLTIRGTKFMYGDFLNSLISFLIITFVVYFFVVLPMNKVRDTFNRSKQTSPSTKKCPLCLSEIPVDAKKCAYCTADLGGQ